MQLVEINIEQKGANIANVKNGVVLESNSTYRYIFLSQIVNNENDQEKSLRGEIIVQKKAKNDEWQRHNMLHLNKLRKDEYFKVDLPSDRLDLLINYCIALRDENKEKGINLFNRKRILLINDELEVPEIEAVFDLLKGSKGFGDLVKKIANEFISVEGIAELINSKDYDINQLSKEIEHDKQEELYNSLKCKLINTEYLESNLSNNSESFWQKTFQENPVILFSTIPLLGQIIEGQPYFGGKAITNQHGKVGDFLIKYGANNCGIIEIKTPITRLIDDKPYRDGVYPPSKELCGAIVQLKNYKNNLMTDYNSIRASSTEDGIEFESYDSKCYLITGNNSKFNTKQARSFNLFRRELKDIEIITFNELIDKLKLVQQAIICNN